MRRNRRGGGDNLSYHSSISTTRYATSAITVPENAADGFSKSHSGSPYTRPQRRLVSNPNASMSTTALSLMSAAYKPETESSFDTSTQSPQISPINRLTSTLRSNASGEQQSKSVHQDSSLKTIPQQKYSLQQKHQQRIWQATQNHNQLSAHHRRTMYDFTEYSARSTGDNNGRIHSLGRVILQEPRISVPRRTVSDMYSPSLEKPASPISSSSSSQQPSSTTVNTSNPQ